MTYRILVTGSREFTHWQTITKALTEAAEGHDHPTVIQGAARGADTLAARAAQKFGWEVESHPADWRRHGKAGGSRRNAKMVALGADICLVFYKNGAANRGTRHCARLAEKAGIPVRKYTQ